QARLAGPDLPGASPLRGPERSRSPERTLRPVRIPLGLRRIRGPRFRRLGRLPGRGSGLRVSAARPCAPHAIRPIQGGNMSIDPKLTVAEILERHPEARAALAKLGLDACCGGRHPLEFAC